VASQCIRQQGEVAWRILPSGEVRRDATAVFQMAVDLFHNLNNHKIAESRRESKRHCKLARVVMNRDD
jgi:hypothetical protein